MVSTYVEVLSADNTIRDRLADSIADQRFLVMTRLCSSIDGTEPGVDSSVNQIGCPVLLPGCPVEKHWENGRSGVSNGSQIIPLPHFSDCSGHIVMGGT
jgi:hypothetical protein